MKPAITIRGLRKSFGNKVILDGIDMEMPTGGITIVIGKSGIGKSVLLKCISGLMVPDEGEIDVQGECPHAKGLRVPGCLSYLFQNNALLDSLTTYDNIALPIQENCKLKRPEVHKRVLSLLKKLDLDPKMVLRKYPSELSGGMQRRVALARALALDPKIILFDEPTTGLDPERKNAVFEMILHYQHFFGYTAVVVTHDLPEALYIADRVYLIDNGKVIFGGSPVDFEDAGLEAADVFLNSNKRLLKSVKVIRQKTPRPFPIKS